MSKMKQDEDDVDQYGDTSPKEDLQQEQATAINLTKHRDNTPQEEASSMGQDTTLPTCAHTPINVISADSKDKPCLINEEQDSPDYRIAKCQSGVHQESLIQVTCQEPVDENNNNTSETTGSGIITYNIRKQDCRLDCGNQPQHENTKPEISPADTPTTFAGLFPHMGSQQMSVPAGESDIDVYRQSYLQGRLCNSQQQMTDVCKQQRHFVNHESRQPQLALNSSSQVSGFGQFSQYGQTVDDEQIAAEQLASELCSTYSGSNSHMISDILKRNVGQNYVHGGFERPNAIEAIQHFDGIVSNHHVLHDVDLLNTPQQLQADDEVCQDVYDGQREQFGDPRASSTPDVTYQKSGGGDAIQGYQASVTYNDIHVHGGRWSSQKSMFEQHGESESPFPSARMEGAGGIRKRQENYQEDSGHYDVRTPNQQCEMSPNNNDRRFLDISQFNLAARRTPVVEGENRHIPESDQFSGFKSPGSHGSSYGLPQHEITKMTFTPREMMETHLSQNYRYQKKTNYNQQVSDYSSIYPSRDFIEKTTGQKRIKRPGVHAQKENTQPRKRARVSKYSTEEIPKVPPQMPMFDSMFQKYVPLMPRDEIHGGKHKYFVVNPSEITQMPPKSLITKYMDFLILENEQITEISKSTNPPVDIYVTEDMYFMDSLKLKIPFPSKKFVEWVASFYPRLNFHEMKFRGKHPQVPGDGQVMKPDLRPTQEILEDTFYFFQREAMNVENQRA